MTWKCKKCGKVFNEVEKPLGHGNLVGNVLAGFKEIPCKGKLVHITRPYYYVPDIVKEAEHEATMATLDEKERYDYYNR